VGIKRFWRQKFDVGTICADFGFMGLDFYARCVPTMGLGGVWVYYIKSLQGMAKYCYNRRMLRVISNFTIFHILGAWL